MIFAWMPWVFMFMLGTFASGLVIYWVANNTITFIQQYAIMRSQGVEVDILGNIKSSFKKKKKTKAEAEAAKPPRTMTMGDDAWRMIGDRRGKGGDAEGRCPRPSAVGGNGSKGQPPPQAQKRGR